MVNLEAFVWDMPTGVLRDVWLALSSLPRWSSDEDCRLERVWVRWHDNSDPANATVAQPSGSAATTTPQMLSGSTMTAIGWTLPPGFTNTPTAPRSYALSPVEYPTLSVLPPLKSLSVLDIDELDYLDEMSVLIAKSKDRLRELRVGISQKAITRDFAIPWDGQDLHQVDHKAQWPGASTVGERRLGGVLGILLGRIYDIRKKHRTPKPNRQDWSTTPPSTSLWIMLRRHFQPSPTGATSSKHASGIEDALTRPVLQFGRMSNLRELSIAIDYKDWVVDVIVFKPELELCYMGVAHKCFEILENRPHEENHGAAEAHSHNGNGGPGGVLIDEDEDEEEEDASDDEDDDEEEDDNGTAIAPVDPDETESEVSDHEGTSDTSSWDGSDDGESGGIRLRLREILFYDDKVAIFKARHGKL
ncbi:hypothetical protein M7I_0610 [Glarea lozoyensis 74030]|uniref:Uncharacterized protein n=1 Tax=Glarea lozoyensis (strain ATCC 74030 / MF5533) TaxID=1104152 RepID=H0EDG2_GLAL7|nr:hypothetical protein M7I_0610 [Glarea lozoyensis 74030]